mmetsp:Transcript_1724/g.4104  ORF Transcript_1724/g.4104 Transcript_1724/m.4104 type:complete len:323 (-) Transcript_1724:189-1157(-)
MNDRLGDLGGGTPSWAAEDEVGVVNSGGGGDGWENEGGKGGRGDEETGNASGGQPEHMEKFFRHVDLVKEDIDAVKNATRQIGEINEEAVLATTTSKEKELSHILRPIVDKTNKRAKRTKNILALLKDENQKLKKEKETKASDMRIRENLCNTLTRKFIDEMKLYQNAQQKYKSDIKKKVTRQVQIVKPDATDEEVDMVLRSEGGREALYRESILAGDVSDSIKTAYANVAGKYQDVLTLEQSVAELHQMFLDFALLTEQQGELLDQIEYQVKSAADYVEDANVDVYEAIEYQKKIRKKQCWIILIVIVLVIIVLFATGILP